MDLTLEEIDILLKFLLMLGGIAGFIIGLRQYSNAQAWKRHEFVADEIRQFNSDHLTRNAMLMIDWGTRDIELFPGNPDYSSRFVPITRPLLLRALVTHDKVDRPYTSAEAAIRDSFDAFFARLERFEQFMQAGLVKQEEFQPYLQYWITSVCESVSPALRSTLEEYVSFYRFTHVPLLFKRFGKDFATALPPAHQARLEIAEKYEDFVAAGIHK